MRLYPLWCAVPRCATHKVVAGAKIARSGHVADGLEELGVAERLPRGGTIFTDQAVIGLARELAQFWILVHFATSKRLVEQAKPGQHGIVQLRLDMGQPEQG